MILGAGIPLLNATPHIEEKIKDSLQKLENHLHAARIEPHDRVILINKLEGYFVPPEKTTQRLKNPQSELVYGTVIKSYNDILGSKSSRSKEQEDAANKFAEQALGKIMITTRKQTLKRKPLHKSSTIVHDALTSIKQILNTMEHEGHELTPSDHNALIINLNALTSPKARMAGVRFTDNDAAAIYAKAKDAFYAVKNSNDANAQENFSQGVSFINTVKDILASYNS